MEHRIRRTNLAGEIVRLLREHHQVLVDLTTDPDPDYVVAVTRELSQVELRDLS